MAFNPIYIDSATAGATLSVGTINSSTVNIGRVGQLTDIIGNASVDGTLGVAGATTVGTLRAGATTVTALTSPSLDTAGTLAIGTTSATGINIGSNAITTNMYGFTNLARNTTGTKNTFLEVASTSTFNIIDFHSSGAFNTDYDSRITTFGGTSADGQGTMEILALNINIQNDAAGTVNIKNGASSTGDINIKSGTTAGGAINIANSTGTVTTNIGAGTGTGAITIGNPSNTTTLASNIKMGNAGTSFRCIILGRNVTGGATGTITISGAPSTFGIPLIFISMNKALTSVPYFMNVNPTSSNTFDFTKTFFNSTAPTPATAINNANTETFNYMAVWL